MRAALTLLCASLAVAAFAPARAAKPAAPSAPAPAPPHSSPPKPAQSTATGAPLTTAPDTCRSSCARRYYFCLAGAEPEPCPGQWTECRAACVSAAAQP